MHLKFPFLACLTGVFIAGYILFQPWQPPVALGKTITVRKTPEIVSQITQDDVVYLGEKHDSAGIHQQQLEIITQLQSNLDNSRRELVIAWEMFQRPFQPILDRYLAGTIGESQLREQTEYETRWGFDWEFYAPILRFAQDQQIPVVALNTPGEITQKVAESGIDSLEGSDYRYIPEREEIKLDNGEYRQRLQEIYQQHVEAGEGNSTDADNFFAAQVLWDETMAEAIALYYKNHPNSQIVVLVGQAHVMYDYAIPERVKRRINNQNFTQAIVLLEDYE